MDYKAKVRNAAVTALRDEVTGFNPKHLALGQKYQIQPFELDWSTPSRNVVFGYLSPEDVALGGLVDFPGIVMYSNESVDEKKLRGKVFSGFVNLIIDMYLKYQKLDAPDFGVNQPDFQNDYQKYVEAAEDAMSSALYEGRAIMQPLGVQYINFRADCQPVILLGDGHLQQLTFTLGFEVHV